MNQRPFSWDLFMKCPIVGIVRHLTAEDVAEMLPIYIESGLTTIEVTMNTPGAAEMIQAAQAQYPDQLNIGAGTVRTLTDLENALAAGAQFIVTPTLNELVVQRCVEQQVPIFPGAFTPTEIERAWMLGATMVKVYPAGMLGPEYIRDIKAPLDDVKLLPTGGVNLSTISDYRKAGADGVGMGSQLIDKALIRQRDWLGLKAHFVAVKRAFTVS
ncbi:bifunctional 4-hydroxy-2-oxoglutarate aldolase/2-dehydro-3-deoxy-phosphogluconate aldolase [Spirosoma aerolatum]|uniref:bifunctional 4-hydroxy-2-oxoglutarate aldolase/2-dehydro-3-deoxy-phosphogluconate aldolase n=1 Tax=Spirosoma aerolatum TaxID=1211326 RepID=UPI0009ACBC27|nr:bifunctional 4-hydroxy-2-oxoglutarate aldolase/2-dehydro-3-deoxy-phosphogluconate aldolase [Spirosoma aerolatum]